MAIVMSLFERERPLLIARATAFLVLLEGCLVLLGWQSDNLALRSVVPGLTAMNPTTALALMLAGAALGLQTYPAKGRAAPVAGKALAAAVFLIAFLKLLSFVGADVGIDRLLFREQLLAYTPPNRMAINTTVVLLLTSAALLLLDVEAPDGRRPAQWLSLLTSLAALLALIGYAYGLRTLYGVASSIPMALNTAVAVGLLSAGILHARPDKGLMAVATSASAGGVLIRRVVPATVAIPAIVGWCCLQGERIGLVPIAFAIFLTVIVNIVVFTALIWRTAEALDRAHIVQQRAEAERAQQYRLAENARGQTRAVLDSVNEAVVFVSSDARVGSVNRPFTEWFGLSPEAILNVRVAELQDWLREWFSPPDKSTADGDNEERGTAFRRSGHLSWPSPRDLELYSDVVAGAGNASLGRLYAFRDVTKEREAERLREERRHQLEEELARAARVQAGLLPREAPSLRDFEIAARCLPAREVGGDFFDWIEPAPRVVTLTLGDVMGKGMSAALLMATVRAALEAVARQNPPAAAVEMVAAALERDFERSASFMTLFHAQVNEDSGRVDFVDAGHGHAFLRRADGRVEELAPRGLPLGVLPDQTYEQGSVKLTVGDALVVYSDGLLDARPELALTPQLAAAHLDGARSAEEIIERLVSLAAPSGPLPDDLTVVVLRRRADGVWAQGEVDAA